MDREQTALEAVGARRVAGIGRDARAAALRAYRAGRDPVTAALKVLEQAEPVVRSGMVAAHLTGRARAQRMADRAGVELARAADPYQSALKFLTKRQGLAPGEVKSLMDLYGPEAATATGEAGTLLEGKVQAAMAEATRRGLHVDEGTALIREAFDAAGMTPQNSYTLENIFRTQTAIGYAAGRDNALKSPAIADLLWGYEYVTVGDDRVRPSHAALDGLRLPKDHPFWTTGAPPSGWSCRCKRVPIWLDENPTATAIPAPFEDAAGNLVTPGPDPGWEFNPADVFRDTLLAGAS